MYNEELPEFKPVKEAYVRQFIHGVLVGVGGASLVKLTSYDDNHFRAVFKMSYFQLAEGSEMPSKSQWNTLKKKIKRRNHSVFIFRDYGQINCSEDDIAELSQCLYLDFGFLYM